MISKYKPNKEAALKCKTERRLWKDCFAAEYWNSALAAEVLWRRLLGHQVKFPFMFLPLRRYHCVGILCFMPNPSQNSHNLPAVIMRSNGPTILGKICMEPKSVGSDKLSGPTPLAAAFLGLQPPVQRVCYYPVRIEIQYWHQDCAEYYIKSSWISINLLFLVEDMVEVG